MGSGSSERPHHNPHMANFHFHIPHLQHHHHHHHDDDDHDRRSNSCSSMKPSIPKGYVAILVGHEDEEELQRFVVPVMYMNHPLFTQLLKEAEEEYGFDHEGPITIPCHVEEFKNIQEIIDRDQHNHHQRKVLAFLHHHHQQQDQKQEEEVVEDECQAGDTHGGGGEQQNHHHQYFLCFKA